MLARTKALTWLAECVKEEEGSSMSSENFYLAYYAYCSKNGIVPATKNVVGRLVRRLYPKSTCVPKKKKYIYEGLKIVTNDKPKEPQMGLHDVDNNQPGDNQVIFVPVGVSVNDKLLKFSITQSGGKIQVFLRGEEIDIEDIGFCARNTPENMRTLTKFAPSILLCQGKAFDVTLVTRDSVIERCQFLDTKSTIKIIRTNKCSQVLSFLSTSNICYKCYKYFVQHINRTTLGGLPSCEAEEDSEYPSTAKRAKLSSHSDNIALFSVLNRLNPKYPTECPCKILLYSQEQHQAKTNPVAQNWDNRTLSACLALWGRIPKAYADMQENSSLLLPSVHFLENFQNIAMQKPSFSVETLQRMAREAERKQLTGCGQQDDQILTEVMGHNNYQTEQLSQEAAVLQNNSTVSLMKHNVKQEESTNNHNLQSFVTLQPYDFLKHPYVLEGSALKCYTCKKPFTTRKEVVFHEIIHLYTEWFECSECSEEFVKKSHLQVHMGKHGIHSDYRCKKCTYSSPSRKWLVDHILLSHKESGYRCTFCSVIFLEEKDIILHLENYHTFRNDDCFMQLFLALGLDPMQELRKEPEPVSTHTKGNVDNSFRTSQSTNDQHKIVGEVHVGNDEVNISKMRQSIKLEKEQEDEVMDRKDIIVADPSCVVKEEWALNWEAAYSAYGQPEIKKEKSEQE